MSADDCLLCGDAECRGVALKTVSLCADCIKRITARTDPIGFVTLLDRLARIAAIKAYRASNLAPLRSDCDFLVSEVEHLWAVVEKLGHQSDPWTCTACGSVVNLAEAVKAARSEWAGVESQWAAQGELRYTFDFIKRLACHMAVLLHVGELAAAP